MPSGVKAWGGTLYVADIFSHRTVDLASGRVTDRMRMHADGTAMEYPFAVGVSDARDAGVVVHRHGAGARPSQRSHAGADPRLEAPYDALPLPDGSVLVAELATGSIVQASGRDWADRRIVATGLAGPVQMARARDGASVYVTEAAGNVVRIEIADGSRRVVASGLALPEGIAATRWGTLVVAEAAAGRIVEIDLADGSRHTVAEGLPISMPAPPGMPPPYVATGLDVTDDGSIVFAANRNNALYRLRPVR